MKAGSHLHESGTHFRLTEVGAISVGVITVAGVEANPKGYNFSVHVTKGHEREAVEAQRR